MEPLPTAKMMLIWLSICPSPKSTRKSTKLAHLMFTISLFSGQILGAITHATYLFKFGSTDLKGSVFSFMGASGFFAIFYVSFIVFSMRYQIRDIFEQLSIIYDNHENSNTFKFLRHANDTSEWMCKLYIKYALYIVVGGNVTLANISAFMGLTTGNFDASRAFHISRFYVPWNTSTLLGYAVEQNFICFCGSMFMVETSVVLLVFISLCFHHQAFYDMLEFSINEWNHHERKHANDEKFILDLVRFHISVKNWFLSTIGVYSPILLIQLISSMIILAAMVYYLDLQIHNLDSDIFFTVCLTTIALGNLFVYCYFGKIGSDSFARMPDCVYFDMKWLRLTPKLKMYIVLIIRNMQRPIYYYGFNVAVMDLNTFIYLMRLVVTFYMMFKTVTEM